MTLQQIITLSFIQGLTEFLPISSSGHLILMPHFLGWKNQGLLVDVSLHVGTLFAVLFYFHKETWQITTGFFNLLKGKVDKGGILFLQLCVATIPAVIFGFSLRYFGFHPRGIQTIAFTIIFFGALLYVADKVGPLRYTLTQMSYTKAFLFGIAQACALIPGTSRAGACLIAGRFFGFKRPDAARFTFLMSIPAIIAAATHQGFEAWQKGQTVINNDILLCILFSGLFGFMAIAFMMYWLKRSTMTLFVLYRFLLGGALLWHLYIGF